MTSTKKLRTGFTTGACAAAAAKAALVCLSGRQDFPGFIEIPFPDGNRRELFIQEVTTEIIDEIPVCHAAVIKDAGDDPDVTNGATIVATVSVNPVLLPPTAKEIERDVTGKLTPVGYWIPPYRFIIKGGDGVGVVTKPGLAVSVGEPAINPIPRTMIKHAAREALQAGRQCPTNATITITISIVNGEKLARKTLNHRLGIVGGLSILGTTGIVHPVSADAWKATISAGMDVAKATGNTEIVLSAGRTSEMAHMRHFQLPEECYILMGDYFAFSVNEAEKRSFRHIHITAQWAKMLKIAMSTPDTHVRCGAINLKDTLSFLQKLDASVADRNYHTARELYDMIMIQHIAPQNLLKSVCTAAAHYASGLAPHAVMNCHLVDYDGHVICSVTKAPV